MGSVHLDAFDAVFTIPKKPERFDSWDDLVKSEPPHLKADEIQEAALFDEFKIWPQPRDLDDAPGPDDLHNAIVLHYGAAYRHNGVDRATRRDQGNPHMNPLSLAGAIAVAMAAFVIGTGAIWWFLNS